MAVKKLLFVDTNIWLDFYRARTEADLSLLEHLEQIADSIIVTSQLEMEFKKSRHAAMTEGIGELKSFQGVSRPGLFSDAKAVQAIQSSQKKVDARVKKLKARYLKALSAPAEHDPVYKICQRIFHKADPLVLTRDMPQRRLIRRRALRRFLLGYPPRKKNDTSMGDAFNWEWMLECANSQNAELVIVSRDADYGAIVENKGYPNDHLLQEFRERVSRRRKLFLHSKLSEALQHFKISVTESEKQAEDAIAKPPEASTRDAMLADISAHHFDPNQLQAMQKAFAQIQSPDFQQRIRAIEEAVTARLAELAQMGRTKAND